MSCKPFEFKKFSQDFMIQHLLIGSRQVKLLMISNLIILTTKLCKVFSQLATSCFATTAILESASEELRFIHCYLFNERSFL